MRLSGSSVALARGEENQPWGYRPPTAPSCLARGVAPPVWAVGRCSDTGHSGPVELGTARVGPGWRAEPSSDPGGLGRGAQRRGREGTISLAWSHWPPNLGCDLAPHQLPPGWNAGLWAGKTLSWFLPHLFILLSPGEQPVIVSPDTHGSLGLSVLWLATAPTQQLSQSPSCPLNPKVAKSPEGFWYSYLETLVL